MNTDYYNIRKHSTSSNSSESNYSTPSSNSSQSNYSNNNNNTRLNDYTFCYNLCCFCSPSRKKIKTEKTFVI